MADKKLPQTLEYLPELLFKMAVVTWEEAKGESAMAGVHESIE